MQILFSSIRVEQGFQKRADFKICGNELILDILKLQMKSKKEGLKHIYLLLFVISY